MEKPRLAFTSLIDISKWNSAKWTGVAFLVDFSGEEPPGVGLLFENERVGREIFDDWRHRFGSVDEQEEIRLSIIEGEISGKPPGYSVTIGPDAIGILQRAKEEGENVANYLLSVNRVHRMSPKPDSPFLAGFKKAYEQHKQFLLMPCFGPASGPKPVFELAIQKRKLHLRQVSDVGENDSDHAIFH